MSLRMQVASGLALGATASWIIGREIEEWPLTKSKLKTLKSKLVNKLENTQLLPQQSNGAF